MNSEKYIELNWDASFEPAFGKPITIPKNTILWRAYNSAYPSVSERPSWYSSEKIACDYMSDETTQKVGSFIITHPLSVIDFYSMKSILMRLMQIDEHNDDIDALAPIVMSLGLCSLRHQIELLKQRRISTEHLEAKYIINEIIEQQGVRCYDPILDGHSMVILKELFEFHFDGIIYPTMKNSDIIPELIIFNPIRSQIVENPDYPNPVFMDNIILSDTITKTFEDLLNDKHAFHIWYKSSPNRQNRVSREHSLDTYDTLVRTNIEYKTRERNIREIASKWASKNRIGRELRVTMEVTPWPKPLSSFFDFPHITIPHIG
jgi:hypothetical protein